MLMMCRVSLKCPVHDARNDPYPEPVSVLYQIERMEKFFAPNELPHLMFFYQDTEATESG